MACRELPHMDVFKAVRAIFPFAEIVDSTDGNYVIDTGCQWTGWEGENVIGEMNIEGESLSGARFTDDTEKEIVPLWELKCQLDDLTRRQVLTIHKVFEVPPVFSTKKQLIDSLLQGDRNSVAIQTAITAIKEA